MGCVVSSSNNKGIINIDEEKLKKRVIQQTNSDIRKNYEFISMLGHGQFGKVRLYRDKNNKDLLFAIKTLKKKGISAFKFNLLKSEVSILSDLDHPNIVKYFGTFEDDYYIHILMEYLKGYDLDKIINLKKYTGFSEKDMARIIEQLLKALAFIHSKQIVHRDIKPENILFSNKKDYSTLKLIDFGLATTKRDKKSVGTPFYMAPEMISGDSCPKSDIWSVGIIVYLMLTGKHPFEIEQNQEEKNIDNEKYFLVDKEKKGDSEKNPLFEKIKNENYDKQILNELECSDDVKKFIENCLAKPTDKRYDTTQCLNHDWITKNSIKNDSNQITNEITITLMDFIKKTVLQKEIYYFIAKVSNENELVTIKNYFNQIDRNNTGTLSYEEICFWFQEKGFKISDNEIKMIWDGLDFHKDGKVNYSEFLAAMISSPNFEKEKKLSSVFNLFKGSKKNKSYITYDSMINAIKPLNLNIDENELKKCFREFDEEISIEDFKKIIMDEEEKEFLKDITKDVKNNINQKDGNNSLLLKQNVKKKKKYFK